MIFIINWEIIGIWPGCKGRKTVNKNYCVISNIGALLKEKAFNTFLRIHRSYSVQRNFIQKITSNSVFVNNFELLIGRSYKDVVNNLK